MRVNEVRTLAVSEYGSNSSSCLCLAKVWAMQRIDLGNVHPDIMDQLCLALVLPVSIIFKLSLQTFAQSLGHLAVCLTCAIPELLRELNLLLFAHRGTAHLLSSPPSTREDMSSCVQMILVHTGSSQVFLFMILPTPSPPDSLQPASKMRV